jgi:hypothetical protein
MELLYIGQALILWLALIDEFLGYDMQFMLHLTLDRSN